ncbi:MAG: pyridoxamine 5'-phosphate oxidase family protein [Deltaproteobacteria bacterium]|nr:pyridoxamine 5'-phosphate oxidase family protein [Deltaproteobacteria bacterium]MBW2127960.1 pyridoxamine 5'-phosphate oxidase family protein [Deltaproteobacteria bacterium]MBW2303224.1 pyridoxamine 5'-phosphate oxidase family protein [Deltaproteobacteria bacterium]
MRRKEKEIKDRSLLEEILQKALVCRLALSDGSRPYVVPLCFGYRENTLYFHSGMTGMKIEILKKNNKVCFETEIGVEVVRSEKPCKWSMHFMSVIGFGTAAIILEPEGKREALDIILSHYSGEDGPFDYADETIDKTVIIQVDIDSMTGKSSGLMPLSGDKNHFKKE